MRILSLALAALLPLAAVAADVTPSPAGAKVYFVSPANGAEVSGPVRSCSASRPRWASRRPACRRKTRATITC
jgi:hypothetical protein